MNVVERRGPGGAVKVVVVGYGMVGHRFVEALRQRDPDRRWDITVLAEEPHPAYDRIRLSALAEGIPVGDLVLAPPSGVDIRLGEPALRLDRERRVVVTARAEHPYDALVLATGSYPFVPPVEGRDLPGVFRYRTVDDLAALRDYRTGPGRGKVPGSGAVLGGGLLGLEAANALRHFGVPTQIVESAPWLMPQQLDEAGGGVLRRYVEALGLTVHTGRACAALTAGPTGAVAGMRFADGGTLEVDVVVVAAGVRPRDQLAAEAGLPLGQRGGVLVDPACRTADPAVWAIGECAAVGLGDEPARCFGLVAPGYAMAEVVADRLVGGVARFPGADTSTKLKLLGVEVASFGAATGPLHATHLDPAAGFYAKLVLSDDASTLLGGMLVGDASAYPTLRASVGRAVPGRLADLLGGTGAGGAGALPATAQVCSCHAVTKDTVLTAIGDGCADLPALKACTRAGTGCGSCVPLLRTLLTGAGIAQPKALCEHFDHSRQELFDIIRVRGIRTFTELVAAHGRGRGCDVCKPVVASILASLGNGYILDGEQAALQDTNDHFLANLQRDGTYSVVPRIPGGEINPEKLIVLGEVARDFGLYTKITGGQRIDLFGARVEQLPRIWRRLVDAGFESGHAYGKALRTVKSCVGTTWCRYGVQDSVGLAIALELRYRGLRAPHKVKAAVSGCARECAEARGKDFGAIATENGWNLYVGGNGGFRPRHADLLASDLSTPDLVTTVDRFLMFYIRTADRLQRTASWLEALDGGLDYLRGVIIEDSLGLCAELDAAMAAHAGSYVDEWSATLADPERLRRFVSFVNAPGTPDPSIRFTEERGQRVPVRIGSPP